MSNQRRVPLGQPAVIFAARIIAIVELVDDGSMRKEQMVARVIELVHELPLCAKEEEKS